MNSGSATLDLSARFAECQKDFAGREWGFAEIDQWLAPIDTL
jgi:hypothetical protein